MADEMRGAELQWVEQVGRSVWRIQVGWALEQEGVPIRTVREIDLQIWEANCVQEKDDTVRQKAHVEYLQVFRLMDLEQELQLGRNLQPWTCALRTLIPDYRTVCDSPMLSMSLLSEDAARKKTLEEMKDA